MFFASPLLYGISPNGSEKKPAIDVASKKAPKKQINAQRRFETSAAKRKRSVATGRAKKPSVQSESRISAMLSIAGVLGTGLVLFPTNIQESFH